jgi:catalase
MYTPPPTTTDGGAPVASDEHSLTAGPDGPILLQDRYLIEQMANFNRERIPERQPHAKGGGAFGMFVTTNDVSDFTRAAVFQPGTETDVVVRFSTVAGEQGSPDTWRDPRGFAVKLYTTEGNLDIVGNNTPVFFLRDPMKFQHFIRSQKRRADSGLRDHDMQWDFWTLSPETAHQVTWLMGDRGIPRTWRHMNGYSSHTYSWYDDGGAACWVKYHFKTDQGIEFLTQADADRIAGEDADYHRRDLFDSIAAGDFPSWTLYVQVMAYEDAATYRLNPFDLTKVWPHADYPLIQIGKLTLNRNVTDFHTEIEQAAFEPNNMVPGTGLSPDQMLLARGFAYSDAHRARLGVNYKQIPVNRPRSPCTATRRTEPCASTTSPIRSTPRTAMAAPGPIPAESAATTPGHTASMQRCRARRTRCARTTTTGVRRGRCFATSSTSRRASDSSRTWRVTSATACPRRCSNAPSPTGATSTPTSQIESNDL